MHSNCRLLLEYIVCKITQRNNIRRANTCDPALKLLNEEITSKHTKSQTKHMEGTLRRSLMHNTHTLWKTIHGLSNRAPTHTLNTSITFNNKIATTSTHCELFHQTSVKHATHKTNRHINRATHNIQGYTHTHYFSGPRIKQSKNNNSQGPQIKYQAPKNRPSRIAFLTSMFKTALNKNIIPHTWKLANIVPIPKPNKDTDNTSYRPISLLSVIQPSSLHNSMQHVQNTTLYNTTHTK